MMRSIRKISGRFLAGVTLLPIAMLGANPAMAQDDRASGDSASQADSGQVITVTARFREEKAQDIGASIKALSGDELGELGINQVSDLSRITPSLNLQDRGPNRNEISIRGVGRSLFQQDLSVNNPNVGLYVDDVPVNIPYGAQLDMRPFDLQRAEVLRGPQGTLFGEGAQAGAIRFFTKDPNLSEIEGSLELEGNTYTSGSSGGGARLAVSVPIVTDKLALRVVGNHTSRGGYVDNIRDGDKDVNSWNANNLRAVLVAEPTDNFRARFVYMHESFEQDAFGMVTNVDDLDLDFFTSKDTKIRDKYDIASANLSYDFGPIKAVSITSYQERTRTRNIIEPVFTAQIDIINLFGYKYYGILPEDAPDFSDRRQIDTMRFKQFSQELRLISDLEGPLNFVAGGFYRHYDSSLTGDFSSSVLPLLAPINAAAAGIMFTPPANPSTTASEYAQQIGLQDILGGGNLFSRSTNSAEQVSVFAEIAYEVSDRLKLIGGLRYHHEKLTGTSMDSITDIFNGTPVAIPFGASTTVSTFLPKASVEYRLSDDVLLYGTYSAGVRNGNINSAGELGAVAELEGEDAALALAAYSPERTDAFEIGIKGSAIDGRLDFAVAGFYNLISDVQTFGLVTVPGGFTVGLTVNAADARTVGFESEFSFDLSNTISIYGGANYVSSEYRKVRDTPGVSLSLYNGKPLPFIPDWGAVFGVNVKVPVSDNWEITGNANYSYTGQYSTFADGEVGSPFNPVIGKFGLFNAGIGIRNDQMSLNLRVDNVFDKREKISVSPITALFGSFGVFSYLQDQLDAGLNFDDWQSTPPRSLTATLAFDF